MERFSMSSLNRIHNLLKLVFWPTLYKYSEELYSGLQAADENKSEDNKIPASQLL